ncbi:MAG: PAS domain S-box protein [Candidatus Hatepunaea meridiana]|nr:PAS domain S-box protein [Candidatus Hatepunaea meridiana]
MGEPSIHILLVEHNEAHFELIRQAYSSRKDDVRLTVAVDLKEARNILLETSPDIVIADYRLNDGKGAELLRKSNGNSDYPIIIMVNQGDEQAIADVIQAGAFDHLVKSEDILSDIPHIVSRSLREWENLNKLGEIEKELKKSVEKCKLMVENTSEEALKFSEEKYKAVIEQTADNIFIVDLKTRRLIDANTALQKLLGYTHEEMLQFKLTDFIAHPPDDIEDKISNIVKEGSYFMPERLYRKKNDELVDVEVSVNLISYKDGKALCVISRDITERKLSEEKLYESEKQLRDFLDNANDLIQMVAPDGRFIYVNSSWLETLGYTREELKELTLFDIIHPDSLNHCQELFQKIMTGESLGFIEALFVANDGSVINVEGSVSCRFEDGKPIHTRGIFRDVTARRQVEAELFESEERFRLLAENVPGVIYLCRNDERYTMLYLNDWVEVVTGYPKEDFLSDKISFVDLYHPEDAVQIPLDVEITLTKREPFHLAYRIKHKNGEWRWIEEHGTAVYEKDGDQVMFLEGFLSDITDRRRAEEEQFKLIEQLRQAQEMESIGHLASMVSHDFNNLLTPIMGYTDLALLKIHREDPLFKDLNVIQETALRAKELTQKLLAFSRKQELDIKELNIAELISSFRKMLDGVIRGDIEVVVCSDPSHGSVNADPTQIDQVLMNLVVNAQDAMPKGGKLTIETANVILDEGFAKMLPKVQPGRYVMIRVTDTGHGMDARTTRLVFDPFFTTKERGKGTGLGLSTVYGIVKQHNGYIWVDSKPGQGTSFRIYLPRVDQIPDMITVLPKSRIGIYGNETILLVERDKNVRELAVNILETYGYKVIQAKGAEEAVKLAEQYKLSIHLLLTCVVMPKMNGVELFNELASEYPEMKVLYMSGYTDEVVAHYDVLEKGVHLLKKPFSIIGLTERVREALNG